MEKITWWLMPFPNCPSTPPLMNGQTLKLCTNTGKHQHALCCNLNGPLCACIDQGSDPFCQCLANTGTLGAQLINGLWYIEDCLVIPHMGNICENLFHLAHDTLGHFSTNKSYTTLRDTYYWPNMRSDLENLYIPSCEECWHNKSPTKKTPRPPHLLPVPDGQAESVTLDFISPLLITDMTASSL